MAHMEHLSGPIVIVHGGASTVPDSMVQAKLNGVKAAANRAFERLMSTGATAVDAVEAAVVSMENDPNFNAGYGASLTSNGTVEMDALVMDGTNLEAGAVAMVSTVANPVSLARKIMENSEHVLLVGTAAHEQAVHYSKLPNSTIKIVKPKSLVTDQALLRLQEYKNFQTAIKNSMKPKDHDTVGAVAIDSQGKVASATSTGGITGKLPGRVGDTPLPGCGGYADNKVGAVSVTGHGEMIMRSILSARIITNLERGLQPKEALSQALQLTKSRTSGGAGAILVTADSKVAVDFSTSQMPWAYRTLTTLHYGIHPNDHHIEKI